jgi:hypothetical protein
LDSTEEQQMFYLRILPAAVLLLFGLWDTYQLYREQDRRGTHTMLVPALHPLGFLAFRLRSYSAAVVVIAYVCFLGQCVSRESARDQFTWYALVVGGYAALAARRPYASMLATFIRDLLTAFRKSAQKLQTGSTSE